MSNVRYSAAAFVVAAATFVYAANTTEATPRRAVRSHRKARVPNMPRGWTWPPSRAMRRAGKRCLAELTQAGVKWKRARRRNKITTPVRISSLRFGPIVLEPIWRKPPFVMDCHLALALVREAKQLSTLGVRRLRFSTIHDYRRAKRDGRRKRVLSRHAVGLAIDVYEFVTDRGTTLVVKRDYRRRNRVLRAIEKHIRASPAFRAVITPGSDARSHADHYHFEARVRILGT